MRLYLHTDGWNFMHDDMLATIATLKASRVHAALAKPLEARLKRWDAIDAESRGAHTAVVEANARVAWVDHELDRVTDRFAAQLLLDCNSNRAHPTFKKFFPEAPSSLTQLGLESQLAAMANFDSIAAHMKLPKASVDALERVTLQFPAAGEALQARRDAQANTANVALEQDAWCDEANKLRRVLETALMGYATTHNHPRAYVDDFFPTQKKPAKKSAAKPGGSRPSSAPQPA